MEYSKVLTSSAVSFPINFFNGIKEVNVGNILLLPSISYKTFKSLIGLKLKIPSQRILTYLVCYNNVTSSLEAHRKVQINEFSDFALITKERNCFILAILKRFPTKWWNVDVPIPVGLRHWNYESQLEYKQRQREMYHMFAEVAYRPLAMVGTPKATNIKMETQPIFMEVAHMPQIELAMVPDTKERVLVPPCKMIDAAAKSVVCKECVAVMEERRWDDFHCCANDEVIVGFRTTMGPIQRPSKKNYIRANWT